MLISTALGEFSTDAAISAPCSVKAVGSVRLPPRRSVFEVAPHLRPQSRELLGRELEREVGRESLGIAFHLLVQPFGWRAIERSQIRIKNHPAPAQDEDRALHTRQQDEIMCGA
jgi:hypothetical protein